MTPKRDKDGFIILPPPYQKEPPFGWCITIAGILIAMTILLAGCADTTAPRFCASADSTFTPYYPNNPNSVGVTTIVCRDQYGRLM